MAIQLACTLCLEELQTLSYSVRNYNLKSSVVKIGRNFEILRERKNVILLYLSFCYQILYLKKFKISKVWTLCSNFLRGNRKMFELASA